MAMEFPNIFLPLHHLRRSLIAGRLSFSRAMGFANSLLLLALLISTCLTHPTTAKALSNNHNGGGLMKRSATPLESDEELLTQREPVVIVNEIEMDTAEGDGEAEGEGAEADGGACTIYENEPLHAIMDRVCTLCHEMYSHQRPNMRADCRSDCFQSDNFKKCLRLFQPSRSQRKRNRTRTSSPKPSATAD